MVKFILPILIALSLPLVATAQISETQIFSLNAVSSVTASNLVTPSGDFNTLQQSVVNVSSSAILSGYSTALTAGYTCITGSTLTVTSNYNRAFFITFDGTLVNTNGSTVRLTPVVNGSPPSMPGSLNPYKEVNTSAGQNFNPSFMFHTPVLPAGTYTFCAALWATGGTTSMPANYPCQFVVKGY